MRTQFNRLDLSRKKQTRRAGGFGYERGRRSESGTRRRHPAQHRRRRSCAGSVRSTYNTPADVRAAWRLDLMAVSDSDGLLDLRTIPWLRLFARFNVTVTLALLVGALSVSGAIFLILELSTPYSVSCKSPTRPCATP
jgi:hypothetical protein